ncbi:MAG: yijF [Acidobacteria bacterium]|nr:yijF [Acidobacteriota bacterium]
MRRPVIAFLALALLAGAPAAGVRLAGAAREQVGVTTVYDPAYVQLAYPNGDIPMVRGVCADVVVRAFRRIGIDLQVELHDDMARNFGAYPRKWGLKRPDTNIDHRRVPNLMTWFARRGKSQPLDGSYEAGDVVAWQLPGGLYHIGVVSADRTPSGEPLVVHNIGYGARNEQVLHAFAIIGHYRW